MITLAYVTIAIAFLLLVLALFRKTRSRQRDVYIPDGPVPNIGNGRLLDLSERIFDPSDARWLAEELAFPKLANILKLERKRLAIHWLEALQESFDEVVRTPELNLSETPEAASRGNWKTLWLTVRFKILVSYALLVVKLFGPYHRLIPSFSWFPHYREDGRSLQRTALAHNRISHCPPQAASRHGKRSLCMRHSFPSHGGFHPTAGSSSSLCP